MDEHAHHAELMQSLTEEYKDILATSEQGVYIYLDDAHKVCNKKFADLLGYESEGAWAKIVDSFPEVFVADQSQQTLVSSYMAAMEKHVGTTKNITWKKKDGTTVDTNVILVPISHKGHLFALHFISVS